MHFSTSFYSSTASIAFDCVLTAAVVFSLTPSSFIHLPFRFCFPFYCSLLRSSVTYSHAANGNICNGIQYNTSVRHGTRKIILLKILSGVARVRANRKRKKTFSALRAKCRTQIHQDLRVRSSSTSSTQSPRHPDSNILHSTSFYLWLIIRFPFAH